MDIIWISAALPQNFALNPVLSTISAATTLLFILGSVWVVSHGSNTLRHGVAWIATSAFIVNAHWYVLFGSDRKDLRIGYFLWWFSFLFIGLALFDLSGEQQDDKHRGECASNSTAPR